MPVHTINVQSLMASVGESQVVDITLQFVTCNLSITKARLLRNINRNVMLLLHTSDIKRVLHLSAGQCPAAQSAWANQLFPHNFAKCWAISKILSKQTQQYICNTTMNKFLITFKSHCYTLWCIVNHNSLHVSSCFCFSHINISQGSVATRSQYGGIFYHDLVRNLLLSVPVKEFWKSVSIWQS